MAGFGKTSDGSESMPGQTTNISQIRQMLAEKKLAPLKSLGQNFLTDQNILNKIVNAGEVGADDCVLEIGPGLGALTDQLVARAGRVMAVEYDRGLFQILQERYAQSSNIQLVNADILGINLERLIFDYSSGERLKVIANLPYYITSPVIFKVVEAKLRWDRMIFLVQKEVAQRICAKPGTKAYGTLTVMLNYYGRAEQVGVVSKHVFYPAPQVDSAILRIIPDWERFDPSLYESLHQVVQAAFSQRRKTILNAFESLAQWFGGKTELAGVLQQAGVDPVRRGETLNVDEFIKLAGALRLRKHRG